MFILQPHPNVILLTIEGKHSASPLAFGHIKVLHFHLLVTYEGEGKSNTRAWRALCKTPAACVCVCERARLPWQMCTFLPVPLRYVNAVQCVSLSDTCTPHRACLGDLPDIHAHMRNRVAVHTRSGCRF